jgi:hypothetical protein
MLSHQGRHEFRVCEWTDPEGYRCFLPPSHPGDHELAWFSRPTKAGATWTMHYRGVYEAAAAQAQGDERELAFHGWHPVSEQYTAGYWKLWTWVLASIAVVVVVGIIVLAYMRAHRPDGELVVVYEYRPPAVLATPVTAVATPAEATRP